MTVRHPFFGGIAMLDGAIRVNQFLMQYCRSLLRDIPDERMTEQPIAAINHPAWILSHLAWTADGTLTTLCGEKSLPPTWATLFGAGSKPTSARGDYPSKDDLLGAIERVYEALRQKAASADAELLSRPSANRRLKEALPTFGDALVFLLSGHMGVHLGQLSTWRRMIGLPHLF
jgi:hypothetical protein